MTDTLQPSPPPSAELHSALAPVSLTLWRDDPHAFAEALGRAWRECGFAVVADHGVPEHLIADVYALAQQFFALPDAHKRRAHRPDNAGQRGYTPFGVEGAKDQAQTDLKEFFHIGRRFADTARHSAAMPANIPVDVLPRWDAATGALYDAMEALGLALLQAACVHLGLQATALDDAIHEGDSILRLLHYPPIDEAQDRARGRIRAAAHEDINVLTLLLGAEEAGLEIQTRDGVWRPVSPPPGCVVVNVADMLQRLTNDVLPSTTHRVSNPAPDRTHAARYSMPFFLHFRPDYVIETLPTCMNADRPNRYPEPITARAYLLERLAEIGLM